VSESQEQRSSRSATVENERLCHHHAKKQQCENGISAHDLFVRGPSSISTLKRTRAPPSIFSASLAEMGTTGMDGSVGAAFGSRRSASRVAGAPGVRGSPKPHFERLFVGLEGGFAPVSDACSGRAATLIMSRPALSVYPSATGWTLCPLVRLEAVPGVAAADSACAGTRTVT